MSKDALAQLAMEEMAKDMNRIRAVILASEKRGDWAVADAGRRELAGLHALAVRKEYSARR